MQAQRKFTDRDVLDDPELVRIAANYLRDYTGDFQFLVDADKFLLENGTLPTALARGVLNCMRGDPRAQARLPRLEERPKLAAVKPLPVRWPRDMKATFKLPYLLSRDRQAKVAHLVRPAKCKVTWYPAQGKLKLDVRTWCSGLRYSPTAEMTSTTEGRTLCVTCQRNRDHYGA